MINEIKNKIHTLVQKHKQGKEVYRTSRFNETQVRNGQTELPVEHLPIQS